MRKGTKRILVSAALLIAVPAIIVAVLFIKQGITDNRINDSIDSIYLDNRYSDPVAVGNIGTIEQKVSCGYACIELLANWQGRNITESELLAQNDGKITTAMGNGFVNEVNIQFPEWHTTRYPDLTNAELLDVVYKSLKNGMPVPVELAALYEDGDTSTWTLHFAIITAMDVAADQITISNPYGYTETYTLAEFLRATRFESYKNMEFYFRLGFAAGVFNKNTVYIIESNG